MHSDFPKQMKTVADQPKIVPENGGQYQQQTTALTDQPKEVLVNGGQFVVRKAAVDDKHASPKKKENLRMTNL